MGVRQLIIGHHFCPIKLIKKKKRVHAILRKKLDWGGAKKIQRTKLKRILCDLKYLKSDLKTA